MKRIVSLAALALMMLAAPTPHATETYFRATMSGPAESTPNSSPGYGVALIVVDDVALTMRVSIPFADLVGTTTAAHIHCCTTTPLTGNVSVASALPSFPDFPNGVRSGMYERTFNLADAATYSSAFISAHGGTVDSARAALLSGMGMNRAYLNIHSTTYAAGEIRGFLVGAPNPDPGCKK